MVPVLSLSIHLTTKWPGWLADITSWSWCYPVSFRHCLGQQEGQNVAVFKRFQTSWPYIDQSAHETASDDMIDSCTAVLRAEMVNFCKVALKESQPRRLQGISPSLHDFAGWRRSCRSFLLSTWSISSA